MWLLTSIQIGFSNASQFAYCVLRWQAEREHILGCMTAARLFLQIGIRESLDVAQHMAEPCVLLGSCGPPINVRPQLQFAAQICAAKVLSHSVARKRDRANKCDCPKDHDAAWLVVLPKGLGVGHLQLEAT